jgi:hypothetical protein
MTIAPITAAEWRAMSRYGTLRVVVQDRAMVRLQHVSLGPAGGILLGYVLTPLEPTDPAHSATQVAQAGEETPHE